MRSPAVLVAALALAATPAAALDVDRSAAVLDEAKQLCGEGKALWGVDMCGPMLLVDPATREVVANRPGPGLEARGEVFVGRFPADRPVANTSVEWNGVRWTMVLAEVPAEREDRAALLMHEAWHRVQADLGFPANSPSLEHLAELEGRVLMRLEFRALAAALQASGEAQAAAIGDALAFRARRHALAPGAGELERQLEMSEGLAEYTGRRLSRSPDLNARVVRLIGEIEALSSYARSAAYATGPAMGLLLDQRAPGWRKGLDAEADLAVLLRATLPGADAAPQAGGDRYGEAGVRAEETAALEARKAAARDYTARLVEGPVLRLPFQQMQFSFNPSQVFPLPPHGTVYPTMRVSDAWGVLEVSGGGLIDPNFSGATVPAPDAGALSGEGWTLKLNDGWRLAPGARSGDLTVEKAP